jgi:hypothetical protein
MSAFDSLLTTLGLLLFMFLVLAASVEAVLEMFRGILETVGFTFLKGKYSVDDALKMADQFTNGDAALKAKLVALQGVSQQINEKGSGSIIDALNMLKNDLYNGVGVTPADTAARLNGIAGQIKITLDSSESKRIFVLRLLSAILGCVLIWAADFHILAMLVRAPMSPEWLKSLSGLENPFINIVVGGFAASAGSSYWHDQLDRIRNLKSAEQQLISLGK